MIKYIRIFIKGGAIMGLKELRKAKNISLLEFSKLTGISISSLSNYENGKVTPRSANLIKLAEILNVSQNEILSSNEEKQFVDIKQVFKDLIMELSIEVPIYGTVPAGKPQEVGGEILDKIKCPSELARQVDYALRVQGMSMVEEGIFEGCLVFVKIQNFAQDKDIIIARKNGEYTIKRFRTSGSESWLEPANKNFPFGKSEFEIEGVVKFILRFV